MRREELTKRRRRQVILGLTRQFAAADTLAYRERRLGQPARNNPTTPAIRRINEEGSGTATKVGENTDSRLRDHFDRKCRVLSR